MKRNIVVVLTLVIAALGILSGRLLAETAAAAAKKKLAKYPVIFTVFNSSRYAGRMVYRLDAYQNSNRTFHINGIGTSHGLSQHIDKVAPDISVWANFPDGIGLFFHGNLVYQLQLRIHGQLYDLNCPLPSPSPIGAPGCCHSDGNQDKYKQFVFTVGPQEVNGIPICTM